MADTLNDVLTYTDESGVAHVVPVDLVTGHEDDRSAEVTSFPVEKGANINDHIIQNADTLSLEVAQTQTPMPSVSRPGAAFTAPKGFSTKSASLAVLKSSYKAPTAEKLKIQPNAFKPGGLLLLTSAVSNAIGSLRGAVGTDDVVTAPTMTDPKDESVSASVFQSASPVDRIGALHDALIQIKQKGYFCRIVFKGKIYSDMIMKRVKWSTKPGEVGLGRFTLDFQSIRIVENATTKLPDPASLRLKPSKTQAKPPKPAGDPTPTPTGEPSESLLSKGLGGGVASS
jgi:Dit-like tail protein